jgi:hypothetical protein
VTRRPRTLTEDLEQLERDDPAVAAAAARLEAAVDAVLARGDVPRTRFRPSAPDRPCEVLR